MIPVQIFRSGSRKVPVGKVPVGKVPVGKVPVQILRSGS